VSFARPGGQREHGDRQRPRQVVSAHVGRAASSPAPGSTSGRHRHPDPRLLGDRRPGLVTIPKARFGTQSWYARARSQEHGRHRRDRLDWLALIPSTRVQGRLEPGGYSSQRRRSRGRGDTVQVKQAGRPRTTGGAIRGRLSAHPARRGSKPHPARSSRSSPETVGYVRQPDDTIADAEHRRDHRHTDLHAPLPRRPLAVSNPDRLALSVTHSDGASPAGAPTSRAHRHSRRPHVQHHHPRRLQRPLLQPAAPHRPRLHRPGALRRVRVYGPGNRTVWEGRMAQFPRSHGQGFSITPARSGTARTSRTSPRSERSTSTGTSRTGKARASTSGSRCPLPRAIAHRSRTRSTGPRSSARSPTRRSAPRSSPKRGTPRPRA
jgi:hypothetical protein